MNNRHFILFLLFIIFLGGCHSGNKSEEIKNYTFKETSVAPNRKMNNKVGDWVQEGTVCYGLVVLVNNMGIISRGLPVKSKVITISTDSIKMKALENISLGEIKGCNKKGLARGETWWETEGDLFITKEEAEAFLKKKGWLSK
jgi:hypothetical protein